MYFQQNGRCECLIGRTLIAAPVNAHCELGIVNCEVDKLSQMIGDRLTRTRHYFADKHLSSLKIVLFSRPSICRENAHIMFYKCSRV